MGDRDRESTEQVERLAALFAEGPVAILTGAGVSTDSGIPDYRGAGPPPRTPMSIDHFMHDEAYRRRFWAGARVGALRTRGIAPNAGHFAIAELESAGLLTGVITQNVDGLHARAAVEKTRGARAGRQPWIGVTPFESASRAVRARCSPRSPRCSVPPPRAEASFAVHTANSAGNRLIHPQICARRRCRAQHQRHWSHETH